MFSDTIRVEWPVGLKFIVIPADIAISMLRNGFVNSVDEDAISEHNDHILSTPLQHVVESKGTDNLNMIVADQTEPDKIEPDKIEPDMIEPDKIEPDMIEPVKIEPVKIEPVKTEPDKIEPVKTEPVKTVTDSKSK